MNKRKINKKLLEYISDKIKQLLAHHEISYNQFSYPALEDRISEVKNLENLELRLREIISEYEIKIKELLE